MQMFMDTVTNERVTLHVDHITTFIGLLEDSLNTLVTVEMPALLKQKKFTMNPYQTLTNV